MADHGFGWQARDLLRRGGFELELTGAIEGSEARSALADRIRDRLMRGPGIVCLRGGSMRGWEDPRLRRCYAALGQALGQVDTTYGATYDVVDRGVDHTKTSKPVSQTSATTGFHTDSSARERLPDFVGLLCLQPARRGGESLVSNALRAGAALRGEHPSAFERLRRPMVRDLVTPGIEHRREALLANRIAVFAASDRPEGWTFRYMRYWIERGCERAGEPLSVEDLEALDLLDAALAAPEHVISTRLERGDQLWINNRVLAHNRTAFDDDPAAPRTLVRMWLTLASAQRQYQGGGAGASG